MKVHHTVSAGVALWMIVVIIGLSTLLDQQKLLGIGIYRVGPNPDLYILGFCIDSVDKYVAVAIFCFLNSGMRTLNGEILRSWITTQVQDISKPVGHISRRDAYSISCIASVYGWFDFFMYMNILMTQIDMMLIEISADVTMTLILTTYYTTRYLRYTASKSASDPDLAASIDSL
jgi:hypothetical protein